MSDAILAGFRDQTDQQLERLEHLIGRLPGPAALSFRPHPRSMSVTRLLGHLLECVAGLCATLHALRPEALASLAELRGLAVNHDCGLDEARARVAQYRAALRDAFPLLDDADLARRVPTALVPAGVSGATLLLNNLEHLINHKAQLFLALRLLGVEVGTRDLYHFVAPPDTAPP